LLAGQQHGRHEKLQQQDMYPVHTHGFAYAPFSLAILTSPTVLELYVLPLQPAAVQPWALHRAVVLLLLLRVMAATALLLWTPQRWLGASWKW
jgi:hypothetical protein